MQRPPVQKRSALVTGCSSGIGLATARLLRDRGWQVVPTARKDEDLDRLRTDGFEPVRLDVGDAASVAEAAGRALELMGGAIGGLVNNAGFAQPGALEDVGRDALRLQFEVNVFGAMDLARCVIPVMRRQGWGRIVNISSVLGRVAIPFNGSYCATKFALEALSDALRVELWASGIGVILVEPGPIVSRFRSNAAAQARSSLDLDRARYSAFYRREIDRRIAQQKKPDFLTRQPEDVARKVLHALESRRPRRRYCVTLPAYAGALLSRFAPAAFLDWVNLRKRSNTADS